MRVFILGAGFSKAVGLPLATELTSQLLQEHASNVGEDSDDEMKQWIESLRRRLAYLEQTEGGRINVEQLFHYAQFDAEACRLNQQLVPVGRLDGQTPWKHAKTIGTWLRHLEDYLIQVIWRAQSGTDMTPIMKWCTGLRDEDHVISFNYDTLLEGALNKANLPWHHGMPEESGAGICISKMHGSIDWVKIERNPNGYLNKKCVLLFQKKNNNLKHTKKAVIDEEDACDLVRVVDRECLRKQIEDRDFQKELKFPGIAGLGTYKPLHKIPGLAMPWVNGCKALRNAKEIIIIGFSLSPFDGMARLQFASAMLAREGTKPKVRVVDPNGFTLKSNFESVFGEVEIIETQWEKLDWHNPFKEKVQQ